MNYKIIVNKKVTIALLILFFEYLVYTFSVYAENYFFVSWKASVSFNAQTKYEYSNLIINDTITEEGSFDGTSTVNVIDEFNKNIESFSASSKYHIHFTRAATHICGDPIGIKNSSYDEDMMWTITDFGIAEIKNGFSVFIDESNEIKTAIIYIPTEIHYKNSHSWWNSGEGCSGPQTGSWENTSEDLIALFSPNRFEIPADNEEGTSFTLHQEFIKSYEFEKPVIINLDIQVKLNEKECNIDLPIIFSQNQSPWNGITYNSYPTDDTDNTIARWGCALTSLAMALANAGYVQEDSTYMDPGELNSWMKDNAGFLSNKSVNFVGTVRDVTSNNYRFFYRVGGKIDSRDDYDSGAKYLDEILCKRKYPVIVGVDLDGDGAGHFVLVTGKKGNRFKIQDPGYRNFEYLDQYGDFITRGYVAPWGQLE